MKLIKIGENEVLRYKRNESIEAGFYIVLPDLEKDAALSKLCSFESVTLGDGSFARLAKCTEKGIPCNPSLAGIMGLRNEKPSYSDGFREIETKPGDHLWQARLFSEVNHAMKNKLQIKRELIWGLGAGKTYGAGRVADAFTNSVCFCPPALHGSWKDEAKKHDFRCPELRTYESAKKLTQEDVLSCVILDECLKIKNPDAAVTQAIKLICDRADVVLGLTGTPTSVSPLDFRTLNCITASEVFPSDEFDFRYTLAQEIAQKSIGRGKKADFVASWNDEIISLIANPHLLTADLSEIMAKIPPVTYQRILCPTPKHFYDVFKTARNTSHGIAQAREATCGFVYGENQEVQELADNPKHKELFRQLKIAEEKEEQAIVWSNFQGEQEILKRDLTKKFGEISCLFSGDGVEKKANEIRRFQAKETQILLASASLSEGMNLQNCHLMYFTSLSLSPVKHTQAIGRIHRQGQTGQCQVYYLLCANTLDERALDLITEHSQESESYIKSALEAEFEKMRK